jgi:cytochrome c oxidase subunit 1
MGWSGLNLLATIGAFTMGVSVLVFLVNALKSRRVGATASDDPWQAGTLEWATSSPPPPWNFTEPPTVAGREPVWDNPPDQPVVVGLRSDVRDVLVTYVLDAMPDHRVEFPDPSHWPLLAAWATTALFIGSIFTARAIPYGSVPLFVALTGWFWPKKPDEAGTQPWPVRHRTLPLPGEAPAPGVPS